MVIHEYFIGGYWWILVHINIIISVVIGGYYINGCWWLFHCKPLVCILLVVINGYFIYDYCIINDCWLLYVILQLLMIIVLYIIIGYSML
jgi:hypothetical protein